ncbi:hypothetical protein A2968_04960 [Candidatus Gottesmanbacteria bacterium RIFCSPLOWO2_01_FULL_42_22]|uniref:Uncharacterized protein n=2 Tax=Candidatus Gottesmaniibacteriota TaxID=1752720 RepID=A0A1F6BJN9_9BACT|nr:MAG: hypothetical protein UV09_C0019G0009 [Candidatus Gottesmanbacteria bacterium GW2011_GWA2_42_18]OGG37156.1 MAG: hypothetical protein A2968_04960 [Candidatus Gottesmanbacteria bacterium RIFCSPLOWO2_01_FULL_42_22]
MLFFSSVIILVSPAKTYSAGPLVWLEDGMTRVFKNDPAKTTSALTLFSAGNEYEMFQIVVKAPPGNTLTGVSVSVSDFLGPNNNKISADNVSLYREHYINVTAGSKKRAGDTNSPLGPGMYPDALVPFKDPATKADLTGRFDASPFNVLTSDNQPVLADVYIPGATPPGQYLANVSVSSDQGSATVQINLNVWNFSLPKTRSLKGFTNIWNSQYKTKSSYIELLKHRLNPKTVNRSDERFLIDNYSLDTIDIGLVSGAGYGNCTAGPPPSIAAVQAETAAHEKDLYLLTSYANEVWDCTSLVPTFLQWAANLRAGGIHPEIVTYPLDTLMGTDLDHTAADIWYVLPKHFNQAKSNINKLVNHQGIQVRSYNPLVQDGFSPKFTIDFPPVNARIMQGFINQSLGLTGTKFWRVDNWTTDPWHNPNLLSQGGQPVPGEGAMVYPGDMVGLPGQVVSGVRMKWFREGSEDFEYIQILKNAGQGQFALDLAKTVGADFQNWTKDKNLLLSVRQKLGEKIHSLNLPPVSPISPPPAISLTGSSKSGDANGDNLVDGQDYVIWLQNYNTQASGAAKGDFDGNGVVDGRDYVIWLNNYLK